MSGRNDQVLLAFIRRYGLVAGGRLYLQYRRAKMRGPERLMTVHMPDAREPLLVRAGTTDGMVLKQVVFERAFDFPFAVEPRFIIDAGANIGLSTAILATRYPDARIVALEIAPGNVALLRRNMAPYPNVTVLHEALWSHRTRLDLVDERAPAWAFQVQPVGDEAGDGRVAASGIHDLLERFGAERADIVKIDIEGAEREVFGVNAEMWLDRVGVVLVETHDAWIPGCSEVVERAIAGRPFARSHQSDYLVLRRAE